jgi:hypothetical protein
MAMSFTSYIGCRTPVLLFVLLCTLAVTACSNERSADVWFSVNHQSETKLSKIEEKHQFPNGLRVNPAEIIMMDLIVKLVNQGEGKAEAVSIKVTYPDGIILYANGNQDGNFKDLSKGDTFVYNDSIVIKKLDLKKLADANIDIRWKENNVPKHISLKYPGE